jgi:predicted nucleotidyltransferase
MRIDPGATLGGYATLRLRTLVRKLNNRLYWDLRTIETIFGVGPSEAQNLVKVLEDAGLAKLRRGSGPKSWTTTELAQSFAAASAAKPITRATADRAMASLSERIERVNRDRYFLARVTRVIIFGSYLRPEVDRLGDVDVAVEVEPKEADRQRLRELNYRRVARAEEKGQRFSSMLDREIWWRAEVFGFLKGRSRSISLHDYGGEKPLVDRVPHRILLGPPPAKEERLVAAPTKRVRRSRRPKDCPF